jgi:hypothetical protein
VPAPPGHPRKVQVSEDFVRAETLRGLAAYALHLGREERLAQLIPSNATAKKEQQDRQTHALEQRLERITATQDNLMRELRGSFDMPEHAGEEYRRRIRADYTTLDTEHQALTAQLDTLAADAAPGTDIDLVSLLPEITTALAELPEDLQAALYAIFDIQIMWNAPMRQATFHATITDTTPQLIQALLNRANDDDHTPPPAQPEAPPPAQTPAPPRWRVQYASLFAENAPPKSNPPESTPGGGGHAG